MAETARSATPEVQHTGVVNTAQSCIQCGYNLQGLPVSGLCPECGTALEKSLRGVLLEYSSEEYLHKLHSGLSLIVNAILLTVVWTIAYFLMALWLSGGTASALWILGLAAWFPAIMSFVGYWKFSEPDPGYAGREDTESARKLLRNAVLVEAACMVLLLFFSLLHATPPWLRTTPGTGAGAGASSLVDLVKILLNIVSWGAILAQFFGMMRYTRWLARRVPDAYIEQRTKTYMWLLPLLSTVGLLLVGLGLFIAVILYWSLLDRMRKHLRALEWTGHPANLDGRLK